jgi:hypothetical protein
MHFKPKLHPPLKKTVFILPLKILKKPNALVGFHLLLAAF